MAGRMKSKNYRSEQRNTRYLIYAVLVIMAVIWLFPIVWIVLTSFRQEGGAFVPYIIPKSFTLSNYTKLIADVSGSYPFVRWFLNTLFVAICSCILSTFITIAMALFIIKTTLQTKKTISKSGVGVKYVPWFYEYDCCLLHFKGA